KADAFVTGLVQISPNKRLTTVIVESIDRDNLARKEISRFEVRTERSILTDVCDSFVLNRRAIRTAGPDDQDDAANKNADDRDKGRRGSSPGDGDRVVELEILYNRTPQELT